MLLLPPPTHYRNRQSGWHISITCGTDSGDQIAEIAADFGCPPPVLAKVHACITYSGRYDCLVSAGVNTERLKMRVRDLGGDVVAIKMADLLAGRA